MTARAASAYPWGRIRLGLALLLVLLYAGASTVRWLHRATARSARAAPDEISANDLRFDGVRSLLPARGVVGYLGSPAPEGATALLHFRRYLLAQYALAPVLLIETTDPEFVVGNFEPGAAAPAQPGFAVVRDFGDGLVLFRRSDR